MDNNSHHFQLRAYCYLDRTQPQYSSFIGTVTQGDLMVQGMASLYVEVSPGSDVFSLVDIALKATEARPGAQIVEREFGMFEVHSQSQEAVLETGATVLNRLKLKETSRVKPKVTSSQLITNVDPYQSQLLNRFRRGSMLIASETLLVLEVAPAAYINLAANEAEKRANIKLIHISGVGRYGRMWMGGTESEMITAKEAAIAAIEDIKGV